MKRQARINVEDENAKIEITIRFESKQGKLFKEEVERHLDRIMDNLVSGLLKIYSVREIKTTI